MDNEEKRKELEDLNARLKALAIHLIEKDSYSLGCDDGGISIQLCYQESPLYLSTLYYQIKLLQNKLYPSIMIDILKKNI